MRDRDWDDRVSERKSKLVEAEAQQHSRTVCCSHCPLVAKFDAGLLVAAAMLFLLSNFRLLLLLLSFFFSSPFSLSLPSLTLFPRCGLRKSIRKRDVRAKDDKLSASSGNRLATGFHNFLLLPHAAND